MGKEEIKVKCLKKPPEGLNYISCGRVDFCLPDEKITVTIIANGYGIEGKNFKNQYKKVEEIDPNISIILSDNNKENQRNENQTRYREIVKKICPTRDEMVKNIEEFLERTCNKKVKIETYEPPLKWNEKEEVYEVDIDERCIQISSVKESRKWSDFPIRLMENASYDVEITPEGQYRLGITEREMWGSNYITPFGDEKDKCHINFLNLLFYTEICVFHSQGGDRPILKIPILIYPRKLEPDEAEIIIKELLEWHSQLIYDLEPTGLTIKPGEYAKKTPIQRLNFIRHLFQRRNLKKILNSIMENPHKTLVKEDVLKEIQDVESPACHLLPELVTEGKAIRKVSANPHFIFNKTGYQFVKAYEEVSKITYDTYPNRFVKFFLKLLKMELSSIEEGLNSLLSEKEHYKRYFGWLKDEIEPSLGEMKRECNRILNRDFFKEVSDIRFFSTPSQTLLKDYRYQQVFSAYLDLIKGVKLSDWLDDLLQDPIKNMPELYEYWCFLKLWKFLENCLEEKGVPKISFQESGIGVEMRYWSEVEFKENKVILSYNRYYGKGKGFFSYSVPLRPDFSLMFNDNLILFDAKYRVDWFEEVKRITEEEKKEEGLEAIIREERRGRFVLGDLYKMHTYREAILKDKKRPLWAIALYPGDEGKIYLEEGGSEEFKEVEDFLKEIKEGKISGGVGAIPLRPEKKDNAQKQSKD